MRTARISDSGKERQTEELAPYSQVTSLHMCDWEGCTTGTIGLPNPKQRSVAKTSGFLHPHIYIYTGILRGVPPGRFLALEGEGITWMGQPSRQGIALFSVRIEFWRSTDVFLTANRDLLRLFEARHATAYSSLLWARLRIKIAARGWGLPGA